MIILSLCLREEIESSYFVDKMFTRCRDALKVVACRILKVSDLH